MPNLNKTSGSNGPNNSVTLRQSTPEHQKGVTLRAISSILLNGEPAIYPVQVAMIEENHSGKVNLGDILNRLLETKQQEQAEKPETERKKLSLDDIYSQVIGTLKSLGLEDFVEVPRVRSASDDVRSLSSMIIDEELLLRLYKVAYEKQLREMQSREQNHYSGIDTTSTEENLRKVDERLNDVKTKKKAA